MEAERKPLGHQARSKAIDNKYKIDPQITIDLSAKIGYNIYIRVRDKLNPTQWPVGEAV